MGAMLRTVEPLTIQPTPKRGDQNVPLPAHLQRERRRQIGLGFIRHRYR
jgi:hypothetical protein